LTDEVQRPTDPDNNNDVPEKDPVVFRIIEVKSFLAKLSSNDEKKVVRNYHVGMFLQKHECSFNTMKLAEHPFGPDTASNAKVVIAAEQLLNAFVNDKYLMHVLSPELRDQGAQVLDLITGRTHTHWENSAIH
jgi:hypothetical protein